MDSLFITNAAGQPNLKKRINRLTEEAEELKFLVGFFYFSGITELYQGLLKNDHVILKILVGLNIDKKNNQLIEFALSKPSASDNDHIARFLKDTKVSLNGEDFDNQDFYERISLFINLIREDRLLIRKTREPNHAKLYISIDHNNAQCERTFITGSSNLTRAGLSGQAEFNVEVSDFGAPLKAEEFFDALWSESIAITEYEESKKQLIRLLEKDTLTRKITPFEAYALALKTYLDVFNPDAKLGDSVEKAFERSNYKKYRYQLDAIKQALTIIEQNHGVIIADVVGLGKSVIASAVAKALGKRGIVLCPPGLIGDTNKTSGWKMYLEQFGLPDWEVRSVGDLEKALDFVRKTNDIEVIIVDEAHRFRNQDTQDYDHLKNICRGKKVILLTATPFNNRPYDILALLNLFVASKQSTITLDPNIGAAFRSYNYAFERLAHISRYHNSPDDVKRAKAEDNYEKMFGELPIDLNKVKQRQSLLAKEIRDVISPVTIRRNRIDLIENPDYAEEVKDLSKVADPKEWFFELSPEQSKFYDKIIEHYFAPYKDGGRFTGVIYQPFMYETGEDPEKLGESDNFEFISQAQLSDFMRRLLVKRFESSFGSFDQSIRRFKGVYQTVKEFVKRTGKYILDRKLIEKIYEEDDEVIDQALIDYQNNLEMDNFPKRDKVYIIEDFKYKKEFLQNIDADIQMFDELIGILDDMNLVSDDPKSAELIKKIHEELRKPPKPGEPKRKIIIFSEFADTVNHLRLALQPQFAKRLLVVSGNLSSSMIHTINQNFDASSTDPQDEYDILLSTDRISEGFNLNRAGMVINYDIPWNPVRVIQRVGRINRISRKVFDELYIVNFFPTEKGATIVKSREIAADKMFLIHNTLGEDVKIFNIDEEPTASALYTRIQQFPEEQEGASFYTQMLKRWNNIIQEHPELREDLKDFPPKVKVSKAADANELLVFFRKNRLFIQRLISGEKEAQLISFEEALPLVECPFDQKRLAFSTEFWKNYEIAKEIKIEQNNRGLTQQSVEVKALNNLKSLLRKELPEFSQHRDFLNILLTDMQEWATLPKYTLRTIAGLKYGSKKDMDASVSAIQELYLKLGPDYLEKEIERFKQVQREIIIAVENQKL
ncbi:MAG: helicase-related protein [Anaerolineaceae bacterium]